MRVRTAWPIWTRATIPKRQEAATFTLITEFVAAPSRETAIRMSAALQSRKAVSGANPNNRNRHWQADDEGADNHQRELREQIGSRSRFLYRHADFSAADFELKYR